MDSDIFEALVGRDPRIKAMLEWRLALGDLPTIEEVVVCFRKDWNKVNEIMERVSNSGK